MELLSYMREFVEVAKVRSFRRAAEALDIPISTISRHIAELEKAIGLQLLHRSTRKVALTEAGQVYFLRCQGIVAEAMVAHEALRDLAERPAGTLRVSIATDLAIGYLGPILRDFARAYPLIDFDFDLSSRTVDLQTEAFDLAIRVGPPPGAPSTLVARPVATLSRYLFASPDYIKRSPRLKHPVDLVHHVFCGVPPTPTQGPLKTFLRDNESIQVDVPTRFVVNNVGMSRVLASLGLGIAEMPTELARDEIASGRLRRVLPEWRMSPVQVHAITDTRMLPARARLFIDFLKARMTGLTDAP
ncbi:MAG: LysR family transcriptional regulator [Burkholderiaceae bacterium]|jgi:DNA-binding transcriptional LysR family regulator